MGSGRGDRNQLVGGSPRDVGETASMGPVVVTGISRSSDRFLIKKTTLQWGPVVVTGIRAGWCVYAGTYARFNGVRSW